MRGQGRVFRPKVDGRESRVWWLDYGVRGARHRESSRSTSKKAAIALLRERIGKRTDGTLSGRPDKLTLADLKDALRRRYTLKRKRSWPRAEQGFRHLEKFFGDAKLPSITPDRVAEYQELRLNAGAKHNTVKYETGLLVAAFSAAAKQKLISSRPVFENVAEGPKRTGFFEPGDFAALIVALPSDLADVVRFLHGTGWRRGEAVGLMWPQIEWDDPEYPGAHEQPIPGPHACVRIFEEETKGKDKRRFPIANAPELRELLLSRFQVRNGLYVFHRKGRPIGDFRKAWERACTAAGCSGRLVHDLRRTAARDFRRAGVPENVVMRLCGWKTRATFDRYDIGSDDDLDRGIAQRFSPNGKGTANKPVEAGQPN